MNILDGIKNFLSFINDHWTEIIVIIGLALAVGRKIYAYFQKTDDEKIAIAKEQLSQIMLKLVTNAELDYSKWVEAGAVKRSEVISTIFQMFPILNRVTDQETLIAEIDEMIDNALKEMREIVSKNSETIE